MILFKNTPNLYHIFNKKIKNSPKISYLSFQYNSIFDVVWIYPWNRFQLILCFDQASYLQSDFKCFYSFKPLILAWFINGFCLNIFLCEGRATVFLCLLGTFADDYHDLLRYVMNFTFFMNKIKESYFMNCTFVKVPYWSNWA